MYNIKLLSYILNIKYNNYKLKLLIFSIYDMFNVYYYNCINLLILDSNRNYCIYILVNGVQ